MSLEEIAKTLEMVIDDPSNASWQWIMHVVATKGECGCRYAANGYEGNEVYPCDPWAAEAKVIQLERELAGMREREKEHLEKIALERERLKDYLHMLPPGHYAGDQGQTV